MTTPSVSSWHLGVGHDYTWRHQGFLDDNTWGYIGSLMTTNEVTSKRKLQLFNKQRFLSAQETIFIIYCHWLATFWQPREQDGGGKIQKSWRKKTNLFEQLVNIKKNYLTCLTWYQNIYLMSFVLDIYIYIQPILPEWGWPASYRDHDWSLLHRYSAKHLQRQQSFGGNRPWLYQNILESLQGLPMPC